MIVPSSRNRNSKVRNPLKFRGARPGGGLRSGGCGPRDGPSSSPGPVAKLPYHARVTKNEQDAAVFGVEAKWENGIAFWKIMF